MTSTPSTMSKVAAVASKAEAEAALGWGWVRRSLASHPLSTAWGFFAAGAVIEHFLASPLLSFFGL